MGNLVINRKMKTIAAALVIAAAQAGSAIPASKVCINNDAGFVMYFYFDDIVSGAKSADTDHYPIDQEKCLDIATALPQAQENDVILTYVKAILGATQTVGSAIVYHPDAPVASYTCTGTTFDYSCKLNGEVNPVE